MPLRVNGVRPQYVEIKSKQWLVPQHSKILKCGDKVVWTARYNFTYSLTKGETGVHIPVVTAKRLSTLDQDPDITIGNLADGDKIYYGDVVEIQVSPQTKTECIDTYTINDGANNRSNAVITKTVTTNINVKATSVYYKSPQLTCVVETTGVFNNKYTVTITNPNNVNGNVYYYIYGSGEYLLKEDTVDLGAKETLTITGSNTWYKSGMRVEATFQDSDNYYQSEFSYLNVNNYESSTGETTTT